MVDLCAIKNSFTDNTPTPHPQLVPLHLPSPVSLCRTLIFSMVSLFLCVSSLHFIGMGCDSLSLSLFVRVVSPFILRLLPSLSSLFKNLPWKRDRRAPAVSLTHSSSLKSKPTEAKSGYYLSSVSSLSLAPILPFLPKVYEILHFEKKGQPLSQTNGCEQNLKGDCCINKTEKINSLLKCEMDVWQGLTMYACACVCVCLCAYSCPSACLQTLHLRPLTRTYPLRGGGVTKFVVVKYLWFLYCLSSLEANKDRHLSVCDLRELEELHNVSERNKFWMYTTHRQKMGNKVKDCLIKT